MKIWFGFSGLFVLIVLLFFASSRQVESSLSVGVDVDWFGYRTINPSSSRERFDRVRASCRGSSRRIGFGLSSPVSAESHQSTISKKKERKKEQKLGRKTHILIRQRRQQLRLAPRQLRLSPKHLRRLRQRLSLQMKLSQRRNSRFTFRVKLERFFAVLLRQFGFVLALVEGETFVDEREGVDWWGWDPGGFGGRGEDVVGRRRGGGVRTLPFRSRWHGRTSPTRLRTSESPEAAHH